MISYRDVAGLLAHHDGECVCGLGDAQGGAVAQSKRAGHIGVMAYGKYASGGFYASAIDDHGSVVERGVLEENVLYQARVYLGVDYVAALLVVFEWHILLYHYQRAGLAFRHVHACIHDRHHAGVYVLGVLLLPVVEKGCEKFPPLFGSQFHEKPLYLVLENDHEYEQTYAHHFVEDGAYELHLEDLGGHYPYQHEGEHPVKNVYGARLFHYLIEIVEHQRHYHYVEYILYSE